MRFDVDRICELAGLSGDKKNLISEASVKQGAAKSAYSSAPSTPPAVKEYDEFSDMDGEFDASGDFDNSGDMFFEEEELDDNAMYEIDESELMEALVDMRQARLEESSIRDAVRDEITRALSDKSSSWMYGSNKPTASRQGQIARGGFGVGFGFKR